MDNSGGNIFRKIIKGRHLFANKNDYDYTIKDKQISENDRQAKYQEYEDAINTINNLWVEGDYDKIKKNPLGKDALAIEKALTLMPSYKGTQYRGDFYNPKLSNYKIGDEFSFGHITSWSKNQNIALAHASKHDKDTPILYKVLKSTKTKDISKISKKKEEEVLGNHSIQYKISDIEYIKDEITEQTIAVYVLKEV